MALFRKSEEPMTVLLYSGKVGFVNCAQLASQTAKLLTIRYGTELTQAAFRRLVSISRQRETMSPQMEETKQRRKQPFELHHDQPPTRQPSDRSRDVSWFSGALCSVAVLDAKKERAGSVT
jgi:hypothetical protein